MEHNVTVYEAFELNRVLHLILAQQSSYDIHISFKIYSLMKSLNEIESFIFDRIKTVFDSTTIDINNPLHQALLSSVIPLNIELTKSDLLKTEGEVKLDIEDVEILEKILGETES